jgi:hypothetical protein
LKKTAYDKLRERKEGREEEKAAPSRVYITLEDRVGVTHLAHRVGIREELQTTTKNLRKSLIRIFRLKNLVWELHRRDGGQWAKLPKLVQVLQAEADYRLIIIERKRKRPNAPGSSRRRHFERANQRKRKAEDFCWRPSDEQTRARPDLRVEPPRPPGWKPLVIVPDLVKMSENNIRMMADQRMKQWAEEEERKKAIERANQVVQDLSEKQLREAREKEEALEKARQTKWKR